MPSSLIFFVTCTYSGAISELSPELDLLGAGCNVASHVRLRLHLCQQQRRACHGRLGRALPWALACDPELSEQRLKDLPHRLADLGQGGGFVDPERERGGGSLLFLAPPPPPAPAPPPSAPSSSSYSSSSSSSSSSFSQSPSSVDASMPSASRATDSDMSSPDSIYARARARARARASM